ncbi:MAG: DUF6263 family protein [Chitinophagales bacterium]|nr:DUF6263 family protein [Chitinophagales bacterium]
MKRIPSLIAALLLVATCFAQSDRRITLSKGQKLTADFSSQNHSVTNVMFQDMESNLNISGTYTITVDDASKDQYLLNFTMTRIRMNMNLMGQNMEYDSDKPETDSSQFEDIKGILNEPQFVRIDRQGKIIETKSSNDSLSQLLQQMGTQLVGSRYVFLPVSSEMNVGDSFQIAYQDTALGTNTTLTYKVSSINGNLATLSFEGTSKTDMTIENFGMELKTSSDGPVEGETVVDLKTGIIQSTKSTTKTTGKSIAMGQEMAVSSNMAMEITVSENK